MEPPHRGTSALEAPIYVLERGGAGQTDSPTQFQTGPTAGGEEATELQVCALERQLSGASSADSVSSVCDRSDDGGGGTALFANQDQDEPPIGQQQPPVPPVQPQHLAATLRSAQQATGTQQAGVAREVEGLTASPKHVFVFSTAGKPIYSYRGDESRLAGLMATAEAILSVAHSKGHTLKHVRAGQHVFAFLERPPLCLVGVSALAEPPAVMRMQLILVHGQIVSLLTAAALSAMFARNPGYDARKLLGGSEGMLSALVDSFTAVPAVLLGAYPSLPLLGGATNAVHGLVVAHGAVGAACPAAGVAPMQQWDVLLLLNLLGANQSFRHSGEAMTPRLQQQLEAVGTLQAVVQCAEQDGVTQQGTNSGSRSSRSSKTLLAAQNLPATAGGGPFGFTPLLHFVYKLSGRQQYVMSPFSLPLVAGGLHQSIIVAYSQLRASMFESSTGAAGPLQLLRFERRSRFVILGAVSAETELYMAFDPLTDKAEAAGNLTLTSCRQLSANSCGAAAAGDVALQAFFIPGYDFAGLASPILGMLFPIYQSMRALEQKKREQETQGATMVYRLFVRPFLLALAEKARRVPAMEPYVRDFTRAAKEEPPPVTLEGAPGTGRWP
ncbi:hypothetical protein CHLNCDRAFT_141799 [Chlorella variabilis]|uniref:Vacuolar fusion protein MON1 homolog n=1 Tax=Chlorella variabilis TaxID=554065 RepID=E1ZTM7_CHLVA|nr:hypothetical protein CHLNCDRAFT_141799 [Chlorella variabilis]EFN50835.1 hypothetical protein CHLNCDRAFT_141799 [Chlorella variabilis]|eukprot:XP_005842937.1 hypothetical protein CHLNCDRAFT_141799 [Chlorella variabilis]